jgi:hypothetical protein
MKKIHSISAGFAVLAVLAGCKQDPYASNLKPGQHVVVDNPNNQEQDSRVFSIEAPDLIECTESENCSAEIIGHVPTPGQASISFKGMPNGASFDPLTSTFSFTPGFDVVDVASHPDQTMILIPLMVTVRSSADSVTETSRTISILVKNKLQPVQINVTGSSNVDEGSVLEQTVEINSPDFPNGPYHLVASGAPVGSEVIESNGFPNRFRVRFTPNHSFVSVNDESSGNGYIKRVPISYQVGLPLGAPTVQDQTWIVKDVRQTPFITAPENLTQGLEVSFPIRAEDMNSEVAPKISVNTSVPFGRLTTTTIAESSSRSAGYPSKVIMVKWDQLKLINLGTTTPIQYEVCVQRSRYSITLCTQKKVMVTLKADLHAAPLMDRAVWKSGDFRFLKMGSQLNLPLPITDAEDARLPVSVKILSNQPDAVQWKNGSLNIVPQQEGVLQFSLIAESVFGQTRTENFVLEVLPESWAKTVILAGDTIGKETLETMKLLTSVELLSPKFQISSRTLALRESCLLNTESLNSSAFNANTFERMFQSVDRILVSSPLAGRLLPKLEGDWKTSGIRIRGRLNDLLPGEKIQNFTLMTDSRSNLESPSLPAGLNGTLTAESGNPIVFDLENTSTGSCAPLFRLVKPGASFVVAVTCKISGKQLTLLGFELADVLLDQADQHLISAWANRFLSGKVD